MGERAVFVRIIDHPFEDLDLNGCVNDARAGRGLLAEQGMAANNLRQLFA